MGVEEQILLKEILDKLDAVNEILTKLDAVNEILTKLDAVIDVDERTIRSEDYYNSILHGELPGHTYGTRVGTSADIDTGYMLLSNVTSSLSPTNFPSAEQRMQVVSTSANDTGAGTGARQVTIEYFNSPASGWSKKTETITLNGLTPVNTVASDIYRIDRFWVNKVGSGLFAAGDVSLQSLGGVTTFDKIEAGSNVFRTAIHFVEKGKMTTITDLNMGVSTNQGIVFILEGTEEDANGNVVTLGKDQLELNQGAIHAAYNLPIMIMNPNGKEMFFAIVVKGRGANQLASGSFRFIDHPFPH